MSDPGLSRRAAVLSIGALFLSLGACYGTWTARLPALKAQWGVDTPHLALLLLAGGVGAVGSFPVTRAMLRRFDTRRACLVSGVAPQVLLAGLSVATSAWVAGALLVMLGVALAAFNVAINAQAVEVERAHGGALMSRLHAVFSGGGMAAALLASALASRDVPTILHFPAVAVALLGVLVATRRFLAPGAPREAPPSSDASSVPSRGRWRGPEGLRAFGLLAAMALAGTIVEGAMSDWSALYLREGLHAGAGMAPLGLAAFNAAMLLARAFGDRARSAWGERRLLQAGGLLAGGGLAVALWLARPEGALAGFACVGLGMAAVSPCVYVAAARRGASALAAVTTSGSVGALVGPPVIGGIIHAAGFGAGLSVVAGCALALAGLARVVRW